MLPFSTLSQRKSLFVLLISTLLILFSSIAYGAPGEVDTSFNPSFSNVTDGVVRTFTAQPDGKILIGGLFRAVNGMARSNIARLNPDLSLDTSFEPPEIYGNLDAATIPSLIKRIKLQSDGKIIISGIFLGAGNTPSSGLLRLNQNGSVDTTFAFSIANPLVSSAGNTINDIEIQADNKILMGGSFTVQPPFANAAKSNFIRLNADGTFDGSFSVNSVPSISEIELQTNGKILITNLTTANVFRYNSDGTVDSSFSFPMLVSGAINTIALRSDGKIIVGGSFRQISGYQVGGITLLNPDGSLDLTFNQNNAGINESTEINGIKIKPDGKILISGSFTTFNGITRRKFAQLNADGTLDTGFNSTIITSDIYFATTNVTDIFVLPNNRVLIGIYKSFFITPAEGYVSLLNSDGSTNTVFPVFISRGSSVLKILQQPNGKLLVAGKFEQSNGVSRICVTRLNIDGTLDNSFIPYYNSLSEVGNFNTLDIQSDGKILVGGFLGLTRLNANGSFDTYFTSLASNFDRRVVQDVKVLPDGKILAAGQFQGSGVQQYYGLYRFTQNGSIDNTFERSAISISSSSSSLINKIAIQPDGKIIVAGFFTQINGVNRGRIARLNADGSLDTSFNPPGGANDTIYSLELQSDNKILIGGTFTSLNGSNRTYLGRLNADGSLDTSFNQTLNSPVFAIKIQPDNKILIGGSMSVIGNTSHLGVGRLNSDGSIDNSFNTFTNGTVTDINLQSDGKILLGGEFTRVNRLSRVNLARLVNTSVPIRTLFDFDGDNKADISVFRSSINRWYQILSGNSQVTEQNFGIAGDLIAPADFDGDGKTDIAIFRNGDWWYKSSINGNQINTRFGQNGDIPRPSDFDGDGKADFIVYRPTNNAWYRLGSTGQTSIIQFGTAGDKPVIGDFDGDGKADVAIYRPNTGQWWYQSSLDNIQRATQFGIASDTPVAADYDGDGKTDLAVYRSNTGVWYILNSSNNSFTVIPFGLAEDKPVPADYDGDGKADIAVFRPSTGLWYLLRSSAGFTALQFGISTDVPIPNAFVP